MPIHYHFTDYHLQNGYELEDNHYFKFVEITLERFKKNENPIATLYDMAKALKIVNKVYSHI